MPMAEEDGVHVTRAPSIADAFRFLERRWRWETRFESSIMTMTEHPDYRAIVAFGWDVVPVMLRHLRATSAPGFWFPALREITGADPVRPEHRGDMAAMREDWLRWADETGVP